MNANLYRVLGVLAKPAAKATSAILMIDHKCQCLSTKTVSPPADMAYLWASATESNIPPKQTIVIATVDAAIPNKTRRTQVTTPILAICVHSRSFAATLGRRAGIP